MSGPLKIEIARAWLPAVRGAIYDALYTSYRGYWLTRLACAASLGWTSGAMVDALSRPSCDGAAVQQGSVLVALPLAWLLLPLVWRRASVARTVTVHDEGLTVESKTHSLSIAWGAVRAVRKTFWDVVIVLDDVTLGIPLRALPSGAIESIADRLRRAREGVATEAASASAPAVPYRSPGARPLGPEDEEAAPGEWVMPKHYRASVLAFPTRLDHLLALVSLKRAAMKWPFVILGLAGVLAAIATAPLLGGVAALRALELVAAVLGLWGASWLVLALAPAVVASRGRFVRERSAGVLYAVGSRGLYTRTHNFERRDPWIGPVVVRTSKRRVAILTALGEVHVIPTKAFPSDRARDLFVATAQAVTSQDP